ncbi:MAG TPA: peptide-methionine (S)-S-oxide reductase MsrA [Methylovirgula sp.]|nr:peptide-methionine (S)-S-oxide reductase MsrA [Methylovirgula sp.]
MNRRFELLASTFCAGAFAAALLWSAHPTLADPARVPPPAVDERTTSTAETAVLAGGCFWGVQGVFQHVKGVSEAVSGYSGGGKDSAHYQLVGTGQTGHAESVRISFDPRVISYGKILQLYFSVATDPTELNRQGPDVGSQYRSVIFATNPEQARVARAYIAQLNSAGVFSRPIVTKVDPFRGFYPAEAYHQNFAALHPDDDYIAYNDLPKIENLRRMYPDLYRAQPKLVSVSAGE